MTHDQVLSACAAGGFALIYVLCTLIEFFTRRPQTISVPSEDGKPSTTKEVYKGADLGCLTFAAGIGTVVCVIWLLHELISG